MQPPKLTSAELARLKSRARALAVLDRRVGPLLSACDPVSLEKAVARVTAGDAAAYERCVKRVLALLRTDPSLRGLSARRLAVAEWRRPVTDASAADAAAPHPRLDPPDYEEGTEGMEQCRRCKSRDVEMTSRQVRGADEGMTTFLRCRACGCRWTA